jgi:hypothetical protein
MRHLRTDAAVKLLFLALRNFAVKWQRGSHGCMSAMAHLLMLFGSRFTDFA